MILLLIWMIVPLAMTLYFSFRNYNLLEPGQCQLGRAVQTTSYFYTDPAFWQAIRNTLAIVLGVLLITVIGGIALALLIDQPMFGQGIVRILVISPFFVMPPVAALVWKNMIMHPGYGVVRRHRQVLRRQADRLVRAISAAARSSSSSPGSGCPSPR